MIAKTIFIDDSPHVVSSTDDGVKINGHHFGWNQAIDLVEALEQLLNERATTPPPDYRRRQGGR